MVLSVSVEKNISVSNKLTRCRNMLSKWHEYSNFFTNGLTKSNNHLQRPQNKMVVDIEGLTYFGALLGQRNAKPKFN